ncbi:hypothetical protein [Saezia sanguinis]|uniref:hypothetical protein n=1 Tax=Saezia sanguinis TaxID=1965230 RepID=UPI00302FA44C
MSDENTPVAEGTPSTAPDDTPKTEGTTSTTPGNTVEQKISDKVTSTVEYHIYTDGKIKYKLTDTTGDDKKDRTVQELKNARDKAKYVYHDSSDTEHDLGTYDITATSNTYTNYGDKLGGDKIYLIDMGTINNFENADKTVKFSMAMNTTRPYSNDVTTAALLGSMTNTGYTDFNFNGGSNNKGESPSPSTSHKNGMNLDLRYLRTDKSGGTVHLDKNNETGDPCGWKGLDVDRQNSFVDELRRYGWSDIKAWEYWDSTNSPDTATEWTTWYTEWQKTNPDAEKPVLKNIKHLANHHHHIHLQGFSPSLEEIKEEAKPEESKTEETAEKEET